MANCYLIQLRSYGLLLATFLDVTCSGTVVLVASPYPARIYSGAEAEVPVLTVTGNNNATGLPVTSFSLEDTNSSRLFKIDAYGVVKTCSTIKFPVGWILEFLVYGVHGRQVVSTQVKIIVSNRNQHMPKFSTSGYKYSVYRYGVGDQIGIVNVTDSDTDEYNRMTTFIAVPGQEAAVYVDVSPEGHLHLKKHVPKHIQELVLTIRGLNTGSPQLTATVRVVITIIMVRQPKDICVSTTPNSVSACWKNPMPQIRFDGYQVLLSGGINKSVFIPSVDGHDEYCITESDTKDGAIYVIQVMVIVRSAETFYGDGIDIAFNKSGVGYSKKCETGGFSPCNFRNPCSSHGSCLESGHLNLTCMCQEGWKGDNCAYQDLCASFPCENNGRCEYVRHQKYRCHCHTSNYGDRCEHHNHCLDQPCQNSGTCQVVHNGTYTCDCLPGFTGANCEEPQCLCPGGSYADDCLSCDPCYRNKCHNGATCTSFNKTQFICECTDRWVGTLCEHLHPCLLDKNPCLHGGRCHVLNETVLTSGPNPTSPVKYPSQRLKTNCECTPGYFGSRCKFENRCRISPCVNGECQLLQEELHSGLNGNDMYVCLCHPSFTGRLCEDPINICDNNFCLNGGVCLNDRCICPFNFTGAHCEDLPYSTEANKTVHDNVNSASQIAALQKMNDLLKNSSDPSSLTADQVNNLTDQILILYPNVLLRTELATIAFTIVGNLARVNSTVSEEVERTNRTNSRLRGFLDKYTSEVNLSSKMKVNVRTPDLHVMAVSMENVGQAGAANVNFTPEFTINGTVLQMNVSIFLPSSIFMDTDNNTLDTRIQFVGYKRSQLFVPGVGFLETVNDLGNQRVISATVAGREIRNLSVPLEIHLTKIQPNRNHTCVFWDSETMNWSTDGMTLLKYDQETVICQSSHLTSFAVLLDVHGSPMTGLHGKILDILTYIGCGISMTALTIVIITYAMFRCLNSEKPGKILLNLSSAMLLLNVSFFLATAEVTSYSTGACVSAGVLLHYFLLVTFMWMLVEAVEMYRSLVTVFYRYEGMYLLKRSLVAWGIPAVVICITASIDSNSYVNKTTIITETITICFLTSSKKVAYYSSVVTPCSLIIAVNIIIFIMVTRVILRPNFQQKSTNASTSVTPAQVRGCFTVMFLLGVTWVFGPLAVGEAKTAFSYMFCICNSLQGFFIFVFRCLFNPEVRLAWWQLFKTGTLKSRRGPIKYISSDVTSKGCYRRSSNSSSNVGSTSIRTPQGKNSMDKQKQLPKPSIIPYPWQIDLNGLSPNEPENIWGKECFHL